MPIIRAAALLTIACAGLSQGAELKHPDWHPDGRFLVAEGSCGGSIDLYVVDTDTGAVRRLYDSGATDGYPRWFPDGERLAFHRIDPDGRARIFVGTVEGYSRLAGVSAATAGPFDIEPAPRDDAIVHTAAAAEGLDLVITGLNDGQRKVRASRAKENLPSWDAAGGIVFHAADTAGVQVYRWRPGTDRVEALTSGKGPNMTGHLSPSGRMLAYSSERTDDREIWLRDLGSGRDRRLTERPGRDGYPRFSPDGNRIAWHSTLADGEAEIRVMTLETGSVSSFACP